MNSKFRPIRILLGVILLGAGFIFGVAWKDGETSSQEKTATRQADEAEALNAQKIAEQINFKNMPEGLNPQELATIRLFEEASPSVVFVTTSNVRRDYWTMNETEVPHGTGSGFIWDKRGHIITNYHVIQGADKATVTLYDQSTWDAELIGVAPEKDLAVLKISASTQSLRPIPAGESTNLLVGQSTYAIGNPFGLDQTLTTGIISALGREIKSVSGVPIKDVIQTDAAINPGNSGGPLLNSSGELIGVNTAIYSPSGASAGIGFSIPVSEVNWVVPDLIQYGKIQRPVIGVELAPERIMRQLGIDGILVLYVSEGSAAEKAGVRPTTRNQRGGIELGDIIIGLDNNSVKNRNDLLLTLEKYKPGDKVVLKVLRDEQEKDIPLMLGGGE